jgi:hypothetical protein
MNAPILLVSVGGGVSDGMIESLAGYRDRLRIIGLSTDSSTPAAAACDVLHVVAPSNDRGAFLRDLARVIELHRPLLTFPCRDADLPALAAFKADHPDLGGSILVGSPALAEAMSDKVAMAGFARDVGIVMAPTAANMAEARALLETRGFPIIAKPRRGSGTRGVYVVLTERQLEHCLGLGDYVVQPYIAPPPDLRARLPDPEAGAAFAPSAGLEHFIALKAIVGRDGGLATLAVDVEHRYGRPYSLSRRAMTAELDAVIRRVGDGVRRDGHAGPFTIQGRLDTGGQFVAFEMLTRIGGSTAGFAMMGFNEAVMTIDMLAGLDLGGSSRSAAACDAVEWRGRPHPVTARPQ